MNHQAEAPADAGISRIPPERITGVGWESQVDERNGSLLLRIFRDGVIIRYDIFDPPDGSIQ